MTVNKLYVAVGRVEGLDVTEFQPSSPLVRRAHSEGQLLAAHIQAGIGEVSSAIEVGYQLGMDGILLATVSSVEFSSRSRQATVTLKGEYFDVAANYDEAAGQSNAALQPEKSFSVTGHSRVRVNYTGSDRPMIREALDDAVGKFAEVMAGTSPTELPTEPVRPPKENKWKWLGPLLVLGLAAFIVGSSGGDEGLAAGATPPRSLHLQVADYGITLFWDPPAPSDLNLTDYQIQRSVNDSPFMDVDAGSCGTACTQWTDFDVAAGNTYRYRIRAIYSSSDTSEWKMFDAVNFTGD